MIIRNGIRSNLRARGRTALFGGLIFALTVLLALGIGMWSYCSSTLRQLDKTYTSVALVEYLGAEYPVDDAADRYAREALATIDQKALTRLKGVELWQQTDRTLARAEGYTAIFGTLPYKTNAVVYCTGMYPYYEPIYEVVYEPYRKKIQIGQNLSGYNALLEDSIYTLDGVENVYIRIEPGEVDFVFEAGKRYVLHGVLVAGDIAFKMLRLEPFAGGEDALPYQAVDGPDDPALTDSNSPFVRYADLFRTMNNALEITASDDIPALEPFHQGVLTVEQGRFPQAGEAGVCLISGRAALQMGLALGDTLTLDLLPADEDNRYTGYQTGMELEQRQLTVVGITAEHNDYANDVWVSSAEGGFSAPLFGYLLGQAVLNNETAQQTAEAMQRMMPDQVRVTLYDQGYAGVASPLKTMRSAALTITLASAAAAFATLLLFAYLFVGRQQETVALLHALGTPKRKITLWMLSGAGVIAGTAAVLGGIAGGLLLDGVVQTALVAAQSLYSSDLRYSEKGMGLQLQTTTTTTVSPLSAAVTVLLVFCTAIGLCLLFLYNNQKQQAPTRGRIRLRVPTGGTSLWGRGALRYAVLAIRRSGMRGMLAAGAACVLALLLGILAGTAVGWQEQLDDLYNNYSIEGQCVSTDGRTYSELTVPAATARQLWDSGYPDRMYLSQSYSYAPVWAVPEFAETGFGQETKLDWFHQQDNAVFLNDLAAAPEFYYSEDPAIAWLDGWDETFLIGGDYPLLTEAATIELRGVILQKGKELSYPALVSETFLEENGLALGDHFPVEMYYELHSSYFTLDIHIVGSYAAQSNSQHLYLPLKGAFDPEWLFGQEDVVTGIVLQRYPATLEQIYDRMRASSFETLRFTLAEATQLEEFRNYLAENAYSSVGKLSRNRVTVLLRDGTFTQSVSNLNRYITFSGLLTPVLLAVVGLLGFIISWLLINGRRMECAVMRGMGASRRRVFFSFFWEQVLLCLAGCIPAGVLLSLFGNVLMRWQAVGIFAACYLIGTAVSVFLIGRTGLMELLSERE